MGLGFPLLLELLHVEVHVGPRVPNLGQEVLRLLCPCGYGQVSAVKPPEVVPKVKVVDQSESTVPQVENEPFTYAEFVALLDHPPIATKRSENDGETQLSAIGDHHHIQLLWPHLTEKVRRLIPPQATAR